MWRRSHKMHDRTPAEGNSNAVYILLHVREGLCSSKDRRLRRSLYLSATVLRKHDKGTTEAMGNLPLCGDDRDENLRSWWKLCGGKRATFQMDTELTPMHQAAANGDINKLVALLEIGEDKDEPAIYSGMGKTPLIEGIQGGHLDVVKLLLEKYKDDPNRTDDNGQTPLMWSIVCDRTEITNYLLEFGVDGNKSNVEGMNAIMLAIEECYNNMSDSADIVKLIHEKASVDLNWHDNEGETALMYCCKFNHHKTVEYLIEKEVDTAKKNNQGQTARDIAHYYEHSKCQDLLNPRKLHKKKSVNL